MKTRQRLFWVLAALMLLWLIISLGTLGETVNEVTSEGAESRTEMEQSATELGASLGAGIGGTMILCVTVPLFLFFALMAWRNGVGLKDEKKHAEMLAAMQDETERKREYSANE